MKRIRVSWGNGPYLSGEIVGYINKDWKGTCAIIVCHGRLVEVPITELIVNYNEE